MKKPKKAANIARKIWRTVGYCENCGDSKRQLHGAHILGVGSNIRVSSHLANGCCLCSVCHRRSHDDYGVMLEITKKLKWWREHEEAVREQARPGQLQKIDWDERIEFLNDIYKRIQEGELTLEEARKYEN